MTDPNFNSRMRGEGVYADQLRALFRLHTKKLGLNERDYDLSTEHFRRVENPDQLDLFS